MLSRLYLAALMAAVSSAALAGPKYGLGRTPTDAEIAAWNIDIAPDGAGLPPGHGSVEDGARLFVTIR